MSDVSFTVWAEGIRKLAGKWAGVIVLSWWDVNETPYACTREEKAGASIRIRGCETRKGAHHLETEQGANTKGSTSP